MAELSDLTAAALAAAFRSCELSPVDVVQAVVPAAPVDAPATGSAGA